MKEQKKPQHIGIVGCGPSGLFLLKTLIDSCDNNFEVVIFEAGNRTGSGFPYSHEGSCAEHITNVSGNEIPALVSSPAAWMQTLPGETLKKYGITPEDFNDYHVFPRLLFGEYLHAQFDLLLKKAAENNINVHVHLNSRVTDIIDNRVLKKTSIRVGDMLHTGFDHVIICTGHQWPASHEGSQPGYFDSPYPPAKIARRFNHAVALKGSSLTAIDAIRTLAAQNGVFSSDANGKLVFTVDKTSTDFCIVMHSLKGLLPGIRFHLADAHLSADELLSEESIRLHRNQNDGFLSLDYIFEKDFKEPLRKKDPSFYDHISDMTLEAFVDEMMGVREQADPFQLLKAEYEEARLSIQRRQSVHWKEALSILSFAMNYPAKYFSAEDILRLQKVLMPLISIVIAFVPQDSCEELFALQDAGRLRMVWVEKDSHVEINPPEGIIYHHTDQLGRAHANFYKTFIDCTGQPHLWINNFPFKTMVADGTISQALIHFRSAKQATELKNELGEKIVEENNQYFLKVPGITITDNFNVVGIDKQPNPRIYMMAVPFMGGYNPDYSGLDFCAEASGKIIAGILQTSH